MRILSESSKSYLEDNLSDLYRLWLFQACHERRKFPKTDIDKATVRWVLHCCEVLELEMEVFFMTIEMLCKYKEIARHFYLVKDPALISAVMIFICNKMVGQKMNLTVSNIRELLVACRIVHYTHDNIAECEREVVNQLNYDFPLTSTVEDLDLLVHVIFESHPKFSVIRKLCIDILYLYFVNCSSISLSLVQIYYDDIINLNKHYENRLYVPIGIILSVISLQENRDNTMEKIREKLLYNFITIPPVDLKVLGHTISMMIKRKQTRYQINLNIYDKCHSLYYDNQ